ncbi:hypothetical protein CHS0354_004886 [Potamilus streckersoni]|uniref:Apple domain-containing protein n=1 Tax=Potamilus streckersoni TaxID=2493646 RepID=A0AAE0SR89_9BIVA|nr:hypothetical protein CHS0354_004886 [Potamilus streckersoni]
MMQKLFRIWQYFQALVVVGLYCIADVKCGGSRLGKIIFIKNEDLNNSITARTFNTRNLLQCARACKTEENICASVYFHEKTGLCSLNSGYINAYMEGSLKPDFTDIQYVELRDGGCKGLLQMGRITSGEVTYAEEGRSITVFCDFHGNHGYTFLTKGAINSLPSLYHVCPNRRELMVRILLPGGRQLESLLKQLRQYQTVYNLSFFLNRYDGYNAPNNPFEPYFYVGFLPSYVANVTGAVQGYSVNGDDFNFTSSDGNPNSYFVFFAGNQTINSLYLVNSTMINGWITSAHNVKRSKYLPTGSQQGKGYFMQFEVHFGGSGGLMTSNWTDLGGVAVGCRFGKRKRDRYVHAGLFAIE